MSEELSNSTELYSTEQSHPETLAGSQTDAALPKDPDIQKIGEASEDISDPKEVNSKTSHIPLKKSPEEVRNFLLTISHIWGIKGQGENPENDALCRLYRSIVDIPVVILMMQSYNWFFDCSFLSKAYLSYLTDPAISKTEKNTVYSKLSNRNLFNTLVISKWNAFDNIRQFFQDCMENIQSLVDPDDLIKSCDGGTQDYVEITPAEAKQYILELADILLPSIYRKYSDKRRLSKLYEKFKNNVKLLYYLNSFRWCEDMPFVQKAMLNYFMDTHNSSKDKRKINEMIIKRINFNLSMNNKKNMIAKLLQFYRWHTAKIQSLMTADQINRKNKETENVIQEEIQNQGF